MEILIYGIINSVSLALYALGFAMVYGVSRLPNFAHGALYVLSGFIVWTLLNTIGFDYFSSVILALLGTGIIGPPRDPSLCLPLPVSWPIHRSNPSE